MSTQTQKIFDLADFSGLLPPQAQEIAMHIGIANALALVAKLGGTTFPVPMVRTPKGKRRFDMLAKIIGEDAAKILVQAYQATSVYIPNCKHSLIKVRNIEMIMEYDARRNMGESVNELCKELALRYRLADRVVWDIVNKNTVESILQEAQPPVQCSLFG